MAVGAVVGVAVEFERVDALRLRMCDRSSGEDDTRCMSTSNEGRVSPSRGRDDQCMLFSQTLQP